MTTNAEMIEQWASVPHSIVAAFGDEGDFARKQLLNPAIFNLLGDVGNKQILDAGCGNGYLCRLLRQRGAKMTGLEPATSLFGYAQRREEEEPLGIDYIQADLSTLRDPRRFDIVIANMVLMDIPDFEGAVDSCFFHLHRGGRLVFSITHPCFEASDSEFRAKGCIEVKEYFEHYRIEQEWGYRFHRPLSYYFDAILSRGGRIEAVVEPKLDEIHAQHPIGKERNLHVPSFIIFEASKSL
ncbi:MAG: class I SAM-dependent methyltransferase [Ardenticatenaceae bacterium]